MTAKPHDLIIVGAGPAGLTAGIYAGRIGLRTLILEGALLGGRATEAPLLQNFPAFPDGITGAGLVQRITDHVKRFGAEIRVPEKVVDMNLQGELKTVYIKERSYPTRSLILSTGAQRKKLLVPGETQFLGQGVSYCPLCDGPLFKSLAVAVVGSEDEAANDALFLTDIARKVALISSGEESEISQAFREQLAEKENFKLIPNMKVKAIEGETAVSAIRVVDLNTAEEQRIPTDGVFVSLGRAPMTAIVRKAGIEVDRKGCIKVDRRQMTNLEGVFAAGDCTCGGMQIVTASGEGATAAISASAYLRRAEKL
jgi:thioredoxin reductase (NADPH)